MRKYGCECREYSRSYSEKIYDDYCPSNCCRMQSRNSPEDSMIPFFRAAIDRRNTSGFAVKPSIEAALEPSLDIFCSWITFEISILLHWFLSHPYFDLAFSNDSPATVIMMMLMMWRSIGRSIGISFAVCEGDEGSFLDITIGICCVDGWAGGFQDDDTVRKV